LFVVAQTADVVETRTARTPLTQSQRSAKTRAALLDAAIESLIELGYHRTSTTEIVRRAGVSRGAQVHHYPTKADLVVAAVERLYARQELAFAQRFGDLPAGERTLERAIDELWSIFSSEVYPAALELVVASRTDPELQVVVHAVNARLQRTVSQIFAEFFPDLVATGLIDRLAAFAFAVVSGAAVSGYAGFAPPEEAVAFLRMISSVATPETLSLLGGTPDEPDERSERDDRHDH
jgi:AcrR family transcriptional regulator